MTRRIPAGSIAILAALAGILALAPGLARACSCAPLDAGERLRAGTPAVIGEVLDKKDVGSIGDPPSDHLYVYTVRVERAFNLEPQGKIAIRGNTNGAACGFSWSVGDRIGAFLYRYRGEWTTSSCGEIAPAELEAAAEEPAPPRPTEPGRQPDGGPGSDDTPALRARRGARVVNGAPRSGTRLERLAVKPGARIRLRLDKPAQAVRVGLARPDGRALTRMRSALAVGGDQRLAWLTKLPRSLPRRTDRLLVAIDYGGERVTLAVGLAIGCSRTR
jgi:hypothetical protein